MSPPGSTHTFVVPAYGHPAFLQRCVESLQAQTVSSRIVIATSTPGPFISAVAHRLGVPVDVNPVCAGIASDWNYALTRAEHGWITLAHQDDWYRPEYTERCLAAASHARDPVLVFTAASEKQVADGQEVRNSRVKRLMCDAVFAGQSAVRGRFRKRLLLAFGNPIPCPSVMINRSTAATFRFPDGWRSNLDWVAWLDLARVPGSFVYVRQRLVHRLVHADAATVRHIDARSEEDERVLRSLWGGPVGSLIAHAYGAGRRQYDEL
jgi:hypothetical protein